MAEGWPLAAEAEFEGLEDMDKVLRTLTQPEWGERTRALGVNLRFASQMLGCTKPQLVQMGRKIGTEALFNVIDCFISSKKELDAWAGFTETAYARLMVAASVMARGDDAA